jgi:hypothetical protein
VKFPGKVKKQLIDLLERFIAYLKTPIAKTGIGVDDDVMTLDEFIEDVKSHAITSDDGVGYYSDGKLVSKDEADPYEVFRGNVNRKYTHVVWYNR